MSSISFEQRLVAVSKDMHAVKLHQQNHLQLLKGGAG